MRFYKRYIVLFCSYALIITFNYCSYSMTGTSSLYEDVSNDPQLDIKEIDQAKLTCVPDEIIIKFKDGADPDAILGTSGIDFTCLKRIHSIEPVLAKYKADCKLDKNSGGWYSFLGAMYKDVNEIPNEDIFREAYSNMNADEKGMYRSYIMSLPQGTSIEKAITALENNPGIEYAEPNGIARASITSDPHFTSLWGIQAIQCEQAWNTSQGEGSESVGGVIVAVIDTGVYYGHPDLADNMWTNPGEIAGNGIDDDGNGYIDDIYGTDIVYCDNDPLDGNGHGTHCAGTIGAVGNNAIGVIGVAPKVKIMAVKGLDDNGSGAYSALAACVKYAADNGAKVLSNSWGGGRSSQAVTEAFYYAYLKGCVSIAAAGNENDDTINSLPANIDTVIAVAASDINGNKCGFSNHGPKIDVTAPGKDILSTVPPSGSCGDITLYRYLSGTSMACPHVAGVAALIVSVNPGLSSDQVRQSIRMSAD